MEYKINNSKKVVKDQQYEKYWSITLAFTDFFGDNGQFRKVLKMIIDHIDYYKLDEKKISDLVVNVNSKRKILNQSVTHSHELQEKVSDVFVNDDKTNATTRKKLNTFIKLGFIKPFYNGYNDGVKEFLKDSTSLSDRKRLFSEIVYKYSSFNSSQTVDDLKNNQIKFLFKTILNRKSKSISLKELIGLMQIDISKKPYANEKDILHNQRYSSYTRFKDRKYNQISHLRSIINAMNFFELGKKNGEEIICLQEDAAELLPEPGNTKRDSYRFMLMKKAVYEETERIYKKRISWFSKSESEGLVVSHIYSSAEALRNYDNDTAYDPNNSLLLKPGDEDQYFDKHKMTFDDKGNPIFSNKVREDFITESNLNSYKIDSIILNDKRREYLKKHRESFNNKL